MKSNHERILARVQKMLTLADNAGATEGERDNALRMAHATLAKYNLAMVDVESANGARRQKAAGEAREEHVTTYYGRPWARNISQQIAKLFFCYYIYTSHKKATSVRHYFIGRKSNVVTAALMAEFVVKSIMKEGNRQKRREMQGNAWLRTFCWGAASQVQKRVNKLIEGADESQSDDQPGTALILASYYKTELSSNKELVTALYPRLGKGRGGKGVNSGGDAFSRGAAYGSSVSLNQQIGG